MLLGGGRQPSLLVGAPAAVAAATQLTAAKQRRARANMLHKGGVVSAQHIHTVFKTAFVKASWHAALGLLAASQTLLAPDA